PQMVTQPNEGLGGSIKIAAANLPESPRFVFCSSCAASCRALTLARNFLIGRCRFSMLQPMKALVLLVATVTVLSGTAHGQGVFIFANRFGDNEARFVLSTDPQGTSSVGPGFQVQLFAGPEGTPVADL